MADDATEDYEDEDAHRVEGGLYAEVGAGVVEAAFVHHYGIEGNGCKSGGEVVDQDGAQDLPHGDSHVRNHQQQEEQRDLDKPENEKGAFAAQAFDNGSSDEGSCQGGGVTINADDLTDLVGAEVPLLQHGRQQRTGQYLVAHVQKKEPDPPAVLAFEVLLYALKTRTVVEVRRTIRLFVPAKRDQRDKVEGRQSQYGSAPPVVFENDQYHGSTQQLAQVITAHLHAVTNTMLTAR